MTLAQLGQHALDPAMVSASDQRSLDRHGAQGVGGLASTAPVRRGEA
jgi:hypothetical protein